MKETYKTLKHYPEIKEFIKGYVIDIGCGDSPVTDTCKTFEMKDGDANVITRYVKSSFDTVFSSHVLEHMRNPLRAIKEWYSLVKEGGYLIITVPDEDLYEQGVFPSKWNRDHKWTFTMNKNNSWSVYSINMVDIAKMLGGEIIRLEIQDNGYDHSLKGKDQTVGEALAQIMLIVRKK